MLKYSIKIIIFYLFLSLTKVQTFVWSLTIYIYFKLVFCLLQNVVLTFVLYSSALDHLFCQKSWFFKTLLLKGTLKCLQSIFMSYWTKGWVINIYCIDRLNLSILAIHWEFWDITKRKFCKIISSLKENLIKLQENCHFMVFAQNELYCRFKYWYLQVSVE